MGIEFCRLGLADYRTVHDLQLRLVAERLAGERGDTFLLTEHPGVFTLGRRGGRGHLMVSEDFLANQGIPLIHIERGGDVTYHGPGQLVLYPIIDLRRAGLSLTEYVYSLEEVMLRLARDCRVAAVRDPRNHGIWSGGRETRQRRHRRPPRGRLPWPGPERQSLAAALFLDQSLRPVRGADDLAGG